MLLRLTREKQKQQPILLILMLMLMLMLILILRRKGILIKCSGTSRKRPLLMSGFDRLLSLVAI